MAACLLSLVSCLLSRSLPRADSSVRRQPAAPARAAPRQAARIAYNRPSTCRSSLGHRSPAPARRYACRQMGTMLPAPIPPPPPHTLTQHPPPTPPPPSPPPLPPPPHPDSRLH